jgi:hypothetical protein
MLAQVPPKSKSYPNGVTVTENLFHGTSPAVRDLPDVSPPPKKEENEERPSGAYPGRVYPKDTVVQRAFGALSMPSVLTSFEGLNSSDSGCLCLPPDTNGDVGPNHYVQSVNSAFRIYDKNGTALTPVKNVSSLFLTLVGSACAVPGISYSDPIVLYDILADRWMISELVYAGLGNPSQQCIAISQTPDPTGAYYTYAFQLQSQQLGDYPKYGVWPDGYYLSVNNFVVLPTSKYSGSAAIVFDRAKMLLGQSATMQEFDLGPLYFSLLPSHLVGHNPPPTGSPNYFVSASGTDANLYTWKFHTDWANPANSSMVGPSFLSVAPFDPELCDFGDCVPQPNTPDRLDTIGNHLMYRLNYRNFGDHESFVSNETVDADVDHAAIRWYELRDLGTNPTVYQQGTYAPDATHRWLGSAAMDGSGNIAVGYSASSSVISPSLRYAGRLATDPLGQLTQGESVLFQGPGVQTGSPGRWGDYSSMSLDPVDDCTFWYTNEYADESGNWATRIGSFKFPGCVAAAVVATTTPLPSATATSTPGLACNYATLTTTGTLTLGTQDVGNHCDDCTTAITLPFPVRLYGQSFTTANVSSNGNVQFGSAYFSGQGQCLPQPVLVNAVAPYWTDLVTTGTGNGVFSSVTGSAPNRVYNLEWRTNPFGDTTPVNFELRFYEGQDTFDMVYGSDFSDAGAAIVGVQKDTTSYTNIECNTAGVAPNSVIRFTLPPQCLATSATATAAAMPTSTTCPITFKDVPADSTFYAYIKCLACRQIVGGYPCGGAGEPCTSPTDTYYRPGANVSRGQLSKILANSAGLNGSIPEGQQSFADVTSGDPFYIYIERLHAEGAISGYECGTSNPQTGTPEPCDDQNHPYFRPASYATRGQISKITAIAAHYDESVPQDQQTFTDVPPDSPFWQFIERLATRHIISGYSEPEKCPTGAPCFRYLDNTSRGQMAKIAANTFFPNCQTPARK